MSSKLKKAIGAVKDQTSISLAKVSSNNNSSNLEVIVLKATNHDNVPIVDKYVNEILQIVSSNKIHAAACARAIGKRIGRTRNWIVALKSLMLVLRIFQNGDPYFPKEVFHEMKRGARILNLSSFRDESNSSPWDFTSFVRIVALYLDERLECFLAGKLQHRYTHGPSPSLRCDENGRSRRSNESVRNMKPVVLLDKMSHWQGLLDRAIAIRPTGEAKGNTLVQISLYAIIQESFDLYNDISNGLTLILDEFYHLQYQACVNAFQICLKAMKQFEELNAYYSFCKTMGVGRSYEYPTVQVISEEVIETLQEYLKDQSSFPPNGKSTKQHNISPAAPLRRVQSSFASFDGDNVESCHMDSEMGSRCTSLADIVSAKETGRAPAIPTDLEHYLASQRFYKGANETGSTRSLPVMSNVGDLISEENKEKQPDQKEKVDLESSPYVNWKKALTEDMSSPGSSHYFSDNSAGMSPEATDNNSTATNTPTQNPDQISPTLQNLNDSSAEFSRENNLSNTVEQQTLLMQHQQT